MGAVASLAVREPVHQMLDSMYVRANKSVASYMGWHGVGMSMAAKAVAKAAKESKLFDVVVLVRAGEKCSPWKLQRRIAMQLDIIHDDDDSDEDEEEEIDKEVGRMIYESLGGRNFLLIIDNLSQAHEGMKLVSMGVPTPQEWYRYKIFITTPNWEVVSAMNSDYVAILLATQFDYKAPTPFPVKADIIGIGGVDELLEHFRDEAGDLAEAQSNNNVTGDLHVQVSRDQAFNCFIYLCLLQKLETNEKELMKYYVGEGLIRSLLQDGKDDLEAAFKVGKALLGEMVSRYMVERSSPDDDGKISVTSHLWKILKQTEGIDYLKQVLHIQLDATHVLEDEAKWMALSNNNNIQTLLLHQQLYYKNPQLTTLLLNDNPLLAEIPDNFFLGIPNLKVLDLSCTPISSLPPSLSCLVRLRFLKLRECSSLNSLPPTLLKDLKQLIILDLRGTPLSNTPTEAFEQMPDLRLLDLSSTNVHSLPASLFSSLCNLEQLFLRGCGSLISSSQRLGRSLQTLDLSSSPQLNSLPTSIINSSSSLKKLMLADCNALEEVMPFQVISQLSALEELDISGCGALKGVENVSFEDMPKLRAVNLSNTKIARLSFTGCRSLEIVRLQGLTNLKSLHLSSLKIKEFPSEISELKRLEQLRLTDVQHLESVEWKKVDWLPKRLEWDQCGCSTASALRADAQAENRDGDNEKAASAFISVSNANIFRGLATDSPIWENCLSKFHIYISPCSEQKRKKEKEKATIVDVKRRKPLVYAGIHSRIDGFKKDVEGLSRHLKIEGVDGVLHRSSIETVVGKAEVLWLRDNGFVKSLSTDMGVEDAEGVKECRVERCHNMEYLFPDSYKIEGLKGRLWVSDMGRLRSVHHGSGDFTALKHLHIECCPKLEKLFGHSTCFKKLETLHIRFCARLERVHRSGGEDAFPELRSLQLWELPKLNRISGWFLPPSLEKLRVRACPKLQRLPLLPSNPKRRIKIEGEYDWWTNLNWDNQWYIKKEAFNFKSSNANNP